VRDDAFAVAITAVAVWDFAVKAVAVARAEIALIVVTTVHEYVRHCTLIRGLSKWRLSVVEVARWSMMGE
jgi:hypothetical protein